MGVCQTAEESREKEQRVKDGEPRVPRGHPAPSFTTNSRPILRIIKGQSLENL